MYSKTENSYLKYAKNISKFSDHPRVNIGAVVVNKHKVVGSGYNSNTKTVPVQAKLDKEEFKCECCGKIHAETMALLPFLKSNEDMSRATVYIYRQKKDGSYGMSRPCVRCMKIIKSLGIKKIVYTTDDGIAREKLRY